MRRTQCGALGFESASACHNWAAAWKQRQHLAELARNGLQSLRPTFAEVPQGWASVSDDSGPTVDLRELEIPRYRVKMSESVPGCGLERWQMHVGAMPPITILAQGDNPQAFAAIARLAPEGSHTDPVTYPSAALDVRFGADLRSRPERPKPQIFRSLRPI